VQDAHSSASIRSSARPRLGRIWRLGFDRQRLAKISSPRGDDKHLGHRSCRSGNVRAQLGWIGAGEQGAPLLLHLHQHSVSVAAFGLAAKVSAISLTPTVSRRASIVE
jgi:hypothetical protein